MTNHEKNNRRYAIGFSIIGSLLCIALFVFINVSVGGRFPWCIYPSFAVLWWPLGVIFYKSPKTLSLAGSLAIIALLFFTNYLTSWDYPWFLFPSFGVIWWPIGVFFGASRAKLLSVLGCLAIIAFAVATNYITSPAYIWYYYPVFAVVFWPLGVFLGKPRTMKIYSVLCAVYILVFFTVDNLIKTPSIPWVLLLVYPVLMWPVCVLLGKRALMLSVSLALCAVGIVYYTILNAYVFPGFPWAVFPVYGLLWWPLAIHFAKRGRPMLFSLCGTLLSAALFIAVNVIASPHTIWAVYPIFALIWWPLSVYYFVYKRRKVTNSND